MSGKTGRRAEKIRNKEEQQQTGAPASTGAAPPPSQNSSSSCSYHFRAFLELPLLSLQATRLTIVRFHLPVISGSSRSGPAISQLIPFTFLSFLGFWIFPFSTSEHPSHNFMFLSFPDFPDFPAFSTSAHPSHNRSFHVPVIPGFSGFPLRTARLTI